MYAVQSCSRCKVMRSVLWFLLVFSATEASQDETIRSNDVASSSDVTLADAIYDKQKVCDAFVGEAVVNAVEKGMNFLVPDEKYLQCMKTLNEEKKRYIETAGVEDQSKKEFTMRLSDKQLVTLPAPSSEANSLEADPRFDTQQVLCMTNKLCYILERATVSDDDVEELNEKSKYVTQCWNFLDKMKREYISEKSMQSMSNEDGKFNIICVDGTVTLVVPKTSKIVTSPLQTSSEKSQDEIFELADSIYAEQEECNTVLRDIVIRTLFNDISNEIPVADERYLKCRKSLDEKKKTYITTALLGMGYYSTIFPMVLSNKRFVTVPVPHEAYVPAQADDDFDIEQELCITNNICIDLVNKKFSNMNASDIHEQNKNVKRCLDVLNNLKLKYIIVKKLEENELNQGKGFTLMCSEGSVSFALPNKKQKDHDTVSDTVVSDASKIEPQIPKVQDSCGQKPITEKNQSNEIFKDLNSKLKIENGVKTDKMSNKISHENEHPTEEERERGKTSSNDKTTEEEEDLTLDDPSWDTDVCEMDDKANAVRESEAITDSTTTYGVEPSKSNEATDESLMKHNEITRLETKSSVIKPQNINDGGNLDVVTYNKELVTKNVEDKVVKTQASGSIKKSEKQSPTSNQPQISAYVESETENIFRISSEKGLPNIPAKVNHENRRGSPTTLEENIIFMENDCNELLTFGENLMKHKMLSSMVNIEKRYDDCIRRLDTLKKIYIEKHNLDVKSHENVFSMNLPSGDQKMVQLPKRLMAQTTEIKLSTGLEHEDLSQIEEFFRMKEEFEDPIFQNREPFDDPVFISNTEFLESLKEETSDTSTLSKIASIFHMSGTHADKKISK